MTLPDRIASALKEPIDQELLQEADAIASESVSDYERPKLRRVIYTLLLERKALLAQVEAERWRDAEKDPFPKDQRVMLADKHGEVCIGYLCTSGYCVNMRGDEIAATHWKPINLPTV